VFRLCGETNAAIVLIDRSVYNAMR